MGRAVLVGGLQTQVPTEEIIIRGDNKSARFAHSVHIGMGLNCGICHHDSNHEPLARETINGMENSNPLNTKMYGGYVGLKIHPKFPLGGYLVGQNSSPNRSKELSIGKNFLCLPSAVGTWLGECQKAPRKPKYLIRKKHLFILRS